jgi:hypothetical protein
MRFKFDFVTNSSSTAFIVFWPHEIKRLEDVSKYIKKDIFAKTIYSDTEGKKPMIVNKTSKYVMRVFINKLRDGYTMGDYYFDEDGLEDFCKKNNITVQELFDTRIWYVQMYKEQELKRDQHYLTVALDLMLKYEGTYAYFFEYGDEGGELFYELEANNDWGGLPYVRISKH